MEGLFISLLLNMFYIKKSMEIKKRNYLYNKKLKI